MRFGVPGQLEREGEDFVAPEKEIERFRFPHLFCGEHLHSLVASGQPVALPVSRGQVCLEVVCLHEAPLWAVVAPQRRLLPVQVCPCVLVQGPPLGEGLVAVGTGEGAVAKVDAAVDAEAGAVNESLAAVLMNMLVSFLKKEKS